MNSVSNSLSKKESDFGDDSIYTMSINESESDSNSINFNHGDSIDNNNGRSIDNNHGGSIDNNHGGSIDNQFNFDDISITTIKNEVDKLKIINKSKVELNENKIKDYQKEIKVLSDKLNKQDGGGKILKQISDLCDINYDDNIDNTLKLIMDKISFYKNLSSINNQNISNLNKVIYEKNYKENLENDYNKVGGTNEPLENLYRLKNNALNKLNDIKNRISGNIVSGNNINVNSYKHRHDELLNVVSQIDSDINKLTRSHNEDTRLNASNIINNEKNNYKNSKINKKKKKGRHKNSNKKSDNLDKYYNLYKKSQK
tara:strand:+ start:55 stop:996 length:942 start_codon:yes stop_codon:yes gene_type:complete